MGKRKNDRVMLVGCPRCHVLPGEMCIWDDLEEDRAYFSRKPHDQRVEASDLVRPPGSGFTLPQRYLVLTPRRA